MNLARLIELAHRQGHRQWAKAGGRLGMTHSEYEYLRAIKDQEDEKTDKDNQKGDNQKGTRPDAAH